MVSPDLPRHSPSSSERQVEPRNQPNLLSLGVDIHHHIVHYLLLPSHSGKPYCDPRPCPSALNLAMTCRTMQEVLSSHIKSDATWWRNPISATNTTEEQSRKMLASIFHWYRVCGSSLTEIKLLEEDYYSYAFLRNEFGSQFLNRVLDILTSQHPPVRSLDLGTFSMCTPQVYPRLSSFLRCIQTTLQEVAMNYSEELMNCLIQSRFPTLTSVEMFFYSNDEISGVTELIRHFAKESPRFSRLSLVQHTQYMNGTPNPPCRLPHEFAQLAYELKLRCLVLKDCMIPQYTLSSIISQPSLRDLQLKECVGSLQGFQTLLARSSLVSRIENWREFSPEHAECLAQFPRLEHVSIKLSSDLFPYVVGYLPGFQALAELTLALPEDELSAESEAFLISSIVKHHSLRKVEMLRPYSRKDKCEKGLTAHSIEKLLISQRQKLECLVVNMRKPLEYSYEQVITDLLKVVRMNNPKLRLFRIILGFSGYTWTDLNQRLARAICATELKVEGLKVEISSINSAYSTVVRRI